MKIRDFIKENREEITEGIRRVLGDSSEKQYPLTELELWVRNDEGLYLWAKSQGVRV